MGLNRRVDPPRTFTPEQAQQWIKLQEAIEAELAGAGLSKTLFVDINGDNGSAERGSLVFKYLTVQAALDAAQPGDVIQVGPGTFTENLTWPETQSVSLVGSGKGTTVLAAASGDVITVAPTVGVLNGASIRGLTIQANDVGGYGVDASGAAQPGSFTSGLEIIDCAISNISGTGGVRCVSVNLVDLQDIDMSTDQAILEEVGGGRVIHCDFSLLSVDYDPADTDPSGGRNQLTVEASDFLFVMANLAWVDLDRDCSITDPTVDLIDDATRFGRLRFAGRIAGDCNFSFNFSNGSAHPAYDFDYSTLGAGEINFTDAGGPSTVRCLVTARFAMWGEATVFSIPGLCDIDIRNGTYPQDIAVAGGDGTIDRSFWFIDEAQGGGAASHAISAAEFGPPLPSGTTDYTVAVAEAVLGDQPVEVTSASKAAQTFDRIKTADAAAVRYLCRRPDYS